MTELGHPPVSKPKVRDREVEQEGKRLRDEDAPEPSRAAPQHWLKAPAKHGRLWRRMRRAGVKRPGLVIRKARQNNVAVAVQCAVLEQETGIPQRNVFGCDWGSQGGRPPYCGDRVTNRRVRAMQQSGKPNGVGWTQLTWPDFVKRAAARRGGAAKPRNQMHVGADVLSDDIRIAGNVWGGLKLYNGSAEYANEVLARFHRWHRRLT